MPTTTSPTLANVRTFIQSLHQYRADTPDAPSLAMLLTANDSYGSGRIKWTDPQLRRMQRTILDWTKRVRAALVARDSPRMQAQMVVAGESLLTVIAPVQREHTGLKRLLMLAIDGTCGVEGYRVANPLQCPYALPKTLQPKQPVRPCTRHPCVAVNALLRAIQDYATGRSAASSAAIATFVETHHLTDPNVWSRIGPLPDCITDATGLQNQMVDAQPGDIILWRNAFHSTGGTQDKTRCNLTAFLDWAPSTDLEPWMVEWMQFGYSHAPMDFGGGKARGAWQNIIADARMRQQDPLEMAGKSVPCLGPQRTAAMVNTAGTDEERPFYRSAAFWAAFDDIGYMVIRAPPGSPFPTLAAHIALEYEHFLRAATNDPDLYLDDPNTVARLFSRKAAAAYWSGKGVYSEEDAPFAYYVDKIDPAYPFDPLRTTGKSHNPQGGGVGVAGDSGMGPMTTCCLETHLRVQCHPLVRGLMRSYYAYHSTSSTTATELTADQIQQMPMVPVLERVRCKAIKTWGNAHLDTDANAQTARIRREAVHGVVGAVGSVGAAGGEGVKKGQKRAVEQDGTDGGVVKGGVKCAKLCQTVLS